MALISVWAWSNVTVGRSLPTTNHVWGAAHAAAGRVRLPHVCIERRDLEISREDADDLGRKPVEHEGRSDRIVRASETGLPEAMTNQDQSFLLLGFFGRKVASPHGLDTEE